MLAVRTMLAEGNSSSTAVSAAALERDHCEMESSLHPSAETCTMCSMPISVARRAIVRAVARFESSIVLLMSQGK